MTFLDRLFGRRPDPTANWGAFRLPIPDFDFTDMRFGTLRFGDAFEAAAFLGRPETVAWTQDKYCELLYASGGFQIDFNDGRFAYLAFFIGPDDFLPKHEAVQFSKPRLRGCVPEVMRLSQETDRATLERLFGPADSTDIDTIEAILFYTRRNITMEFEMDRKTERLKRWNLYPK